MEEIFTFSSQPVQEECKILKEKPPDPRMGVKRARSQKDVDGGELRTSADTRFKVKFLGQSS